jgi:hypothetical protein
MSITKRPVFPMPADVEPIFEFPLRIFSHRLLMKIISELEYHLSYSSSKIINYKKNGTSLWNIQPVLDHRFIVQSLLDTP